MRRIKQAFDCEIQCILYVFCAFDQTGDGMYSIYIAFHCQKD